MSVFDKEQVRDRLLREHWENREIVFQNVQKENAALWRCLADLSDPERYENGMFKHPVTGKLMLPYEYAQATLGEWLAVATIG